jgi:hypothetical protein
MVRNNLFLKVISLVMVLVVLWIPVYVIAQDAMTTFAQGKMDGEQDATGNALWILAGAGCGIFGVGFAYFNKPSPPAHALVGKSAEYVLGYTESYQNKSRNKNVGYACGGWAAFIAIYAAAGGFESSSSSN